MESPVPQGVEPVDPQGPCSSDLEPLPGALTEMPTFFRAGVRSSLDGLIFVPGGQSVQQTLREGVLRARRE